MPNYIRGTEAAATNAVDQQDLIDRRKQRDNLLKTRTETSAAYNQAQANLSKFQQMVIEYQAANKIRDPSESEREVIAVVTRSVSDVRLTGPGHGVSDMDRKIAAHALKLKKLANEAEKAWNAAGKVFIGC